MLHRILVRTHFQYCDYFLLLLLRILLHAQAVTRCTPSAFGAASLD